MVHIAKLIDSMRRLLWRHGAVAGDRLEHRIDERGDHHIDVTIPAKLAEYEPPRRRAGPEVYPWGMGPSAPAMPEPKK